MSYVLVRRRRPGMGDMASDIAAGNAQAIAYAIAHPEDPMSARTLIASSTYRTSPLPAATPAGWDSTVWGGVLQGRLLSPGGVQASIASVDPVLAAQIAQTVQFSQQQPPTPVIPDRTVQTPASYLLPVSMQQTTTSSSAMDVLSAPIMGIPTWMLLAGGVGVLFLFGGKHD